MLGDGFLDRIARRARDGDLGAAIGGRQRLAIDLAVGGERQRRQRHEGGGNHVLRQPLLERCAQVGDGERFAARNDVGHQPRIAGRVLAQQHHRLAHLRLLGQGRLDLAQFDAKAAQLDLLIDAAEILEFAIWQTTREIAGAI